MTHENTDPNNANELYRAPREKLRSVNEDMTKRNILWHDHSTENLSKRIDLAEHEARQADSNFRMGRNHPEEREYQFRTVSNNFDRESSETQSKLLRRDVTFTEHADKTARQSFLPLLGLAAKLLQGGG